MSGYCGRIQVNTQEACHQDTEEDKDGGLMEKPPGFHENINNEV
jgi:hypothetical protein